MTGFRRQFIRRALLAALLSLGGVLLNAGSARAFINGVDTTLVPPAPNNSLLIEIPPSGGGEITAVVWPYNGGSPSASDDHLGATGDAGLGQDIDDCAGAKFTVYYNPTGNGGDRSYGNTTCNIQGTPDATGADGGFTAVSQSTTSSVSTPDGKMQSVMDTLVQTPGSEAHPLQVRQKTIIRENARWFATIYYITNTSSRQFGAEENPPQSSGTSGVRFLQGIDWNFNGTFANTDQATFDTAANILFGFDTSLMGTDIAYGAFSSCTDVPVDDFGTDRYDQTWIQMRTGKFNTSPNFTGDASGGARWNLGLLEIGQTKHFSLIWAVGFDEAEVRANVAAGCATRRDVAVLSIDNPPDGEQIILGDVIDIDATIGLLGLVDLSNIPVEVTIEKTDLSCSFTNSMGNVTLSVPNAQTGSPAGYSWDTAAESCGEGDYNITVCTTLGTDQTAGNDCRTITVTLADLTLTLEPDQELTVDRGMDADYPVVLSNTGPAQLVDFDVGSSSRGWPTILLDDMNNLIAEDTDGDGTWDSIVSCASSPAFCDSNMDGNPDLIVPAGAAGSPVTVNIVFRKHVPLVSLQGVTDTTNLLAQPAISDPDTATFLTSSTPPPTQTKTQHLHSGGTMDTFPDTSADTTRTQVPAFSTQWFQQTPAFQTPFVIADDPVISLFLGTSGGTRNITVSLFATDGSSTIAVGSETRDVNSGNNPSTPQVFTFPVDQVSIPVGYRLTLAIKNNSSSSSLYVYHDNTPSPSSRIDIPTYTYIAIDYEGAFDAAYPGGVQQSAFDPSGTAIGAYMRARITDPFGQQDIGGGAMNLDPALITITQPDASYYQIEYPPGSGTIVELNRWPLPAAVDMDAGGRVYDLGIQLQAELPGTYTVCIQGNESNGVQTGCSFQFSVNSTTDVDLIAFTADGYEDAVHVRWETAQEIGTLGYNIYRSQWPDRGFIRINDELIAGLGYDELGGDYLFADRTVEPDQTYFYLLEEVERSGERTTFGPVSAVASSGTPAPSVSGERLTNAIFQDRIPTEWVEGGPWGDGAELPSAPAGGQVLVSRTEPAEDGSHSLTIEIDVPPVAWDQVDVDGTSWDAASIEGYGRLGEPGAPDVPSTSLLVDVPTGLDFEWTLESVTSTAVAGKQLVPAAPPALPSSELNDAQDLASGGSDPVADPLIYGSEEAWPGAWALVERGPDLGGTGTLLVSVYPVQARPALDAAEVASHLRLRVDLSPFDPPELSAEEALRTQWEIVSGAAAKVLVTDRGIQRVSTAALAGAGLDLSADAGTVQVFYRGSEIPRLVNDGGDGVLDPGDSIEFYGEPADTEFTKTAVYWVRIGSESGRAPERIDAMPALADPVSADTVHLARARTASEKLYFMTLDAPGEPHWFHTAVQASAGGSKSVDVPVAVSGLVGNAGDQAIVSFDVRGATRSTRIAPDHRLQVLLNGNIVADVRYDGYERVRRRVPVPVAWLNEGANTVRYTAIADSGVVDAVYIGPTEIFYPRDFTASGGRLRAALPENGRYTLSGFGSGDVRLFDVADPREPAIFENVALTDTGTGWEVSFAVPGGAADRTVLAIEGAAALTPEVLPAESTTPADSESGADYVIVTHPAFREALAPLIELRESQGLRVAVADIGEVYDSFAFGELDPHAIQGLMRWAAVAWPGKAPRYLLLVGDSTYDVLDRFGAANNPAPEDSLVPSVLYDNPYFRTGSDNAFGFIDADTLPDVGVGRIPARSVADVEAVVQKILTYEQTPMDADFAKNVLLVADNAKGVISNDFDFIFRKFVRDELGLLVTESGFVADLALLADAQGGVVQGVEEMTDRIVEALNAGVLLAGYVGHGSILGWGDESIFRTKNPLQPDGPANPDHVERISNAGRLAVVTVFDCLNAFYVNPFSVSLGERLALDPDSGVVAFWGPSGLTPPNIQHRVGAALYRAILEEGTVRLGDAARVAFAAAASDPNLVDVVHTWVLLGDPALRLRVNHAPSLELPVLIRAQPGEPVMLDGSVASDPNEDDLSYAWEVVEGPGGATLDGAGSVQAMLSAGEQGTYLVQLTVTDEFGAAGSARTMVQVGGTDAGCGLGGGGPLGTALVLLLPALLWRSTRRRRFSRG